jgi:uncharacterized lipoprotein YajG
LIIDAYRPVKRDFIDTPQIRILSMNRNDFLSGLVIAVTTISLTGCSGAPSSGDIKKAVIAQVDQTNQQFKQLGAQLGSQSAGNAMLIKVNEVKKVDCTAVKDSKAYDCDVEINTTTINGSNKTVNRMRFIKASDGWQITGR